MAVPVAAPAVASTPLAPAVAVVVAAPVLVRRRAVVVAAAAVLAGPLGATRAAATLPRGRRRRQARPTHRTSTAPRSGASCGRRKEPVRCRFRRGEFRRLRLRRRLRRASSSIGARAQRRGHAVQPPPHRLHHCVQLAHNVVKPATGAAATIAATIATARRGRRLGARRPTLDEFQNEGVTIPLIAAAAAAAPSAATSATNPAATLGARRGPALLCGGRWGRKRGGGLGRGLVHHVRARRKGWPPAAAAILPVAATVLGMAAALVIAQIAALVLLVLVLQHLRTVHGQDLGRAIEVHVRLPRQRGVAVLRRWRPTPAVAWGLTLLL